MVTAVAIIGSSCRLPGGVNKPSQIWDALLEGDNKLSSSPPTSRSCKPNTLYDQDRIGKAGWIDDEGVVSFDPSFFRITPAEAAILRPNTRLALELTWEALETAGIPPGSLKGKNVSVSIGVGTEDGWDLKRYCKEGEDAFDLHWAANSDPSGVSGHISHFFDFRGPTSVTSSACSSAAFALRDGIRSVLNDDCDIAVVGGTTTHFFPAPFHWATSVNVASRRGRCSSFSADADGYAPSEGAVYFILRRLDVAVKNRNPILGVIRALVTGHNGSTKAMAVPSLDAQESLYRKLLDTAGLTASDITLMEAHGTGTRLGDAIEAEAIRNVYGRTSRKTPLWLSSSKTVFGHCQAASAFVGILKAIASFEHRSTPPHGVIPLAEFLKGDLRIPTTLTRLNDEPIIAQINSFGFTGSIASVILEQPPDCSKSAPLVAPVGTARYALPFSAASTESLEQYIRDVCAWCIRTDCSLYILGTILSLSRDHHPIRRCFVLSDLSELHLLQNNQLHYQSPHLPYKFEECGSSLEEKISSLLMFDETPSSTKQEMLKVLPLDVSLEQAAAFLYEHGYRLNFNVFYETTSCPSYEEYLCSFPTYPFNRKMCWNNHISPFHSGPLALNSGRSYDGSPEPATLQRVLKIISDVANTYPEKTPSNANIFDIGIDSINSIELASSLSKAFGTRVSAMELYSLLTADAILEYVKDSGRTTSADELSQVDIDKWVQEYGSPFDVSSLTSDKHGSNAHGRYVLLTGANGKLGCHVLNRLLNDHSVTTIYCLVRGNAWDRLSSAYKSNGYYPEDLSVMNERGKLKVFRTTRLDGELLGCTQDEYETLLHTVDTIIHAAWRLDFNLPLAGFRDCLLSSRKLAEISVKGLKKVSYFFISSYSSYFGFDAARLPEKPLVPLLRYSLVQGYAISKLIAEHALIALNRAYSDLFNLRIVRIGQICGNSLSGNWTQDEMVPMIIKSIPALNAVLMNVPDVSWIPSDVCADVVHDLITGPISESLRVLHIANPHIVPWGEVTSFISFFLGIPDLPLLSDIDYIDRVDALGKSVPIYRLMPYLQHAASHGGFLNKYCSLDVQETLELSSALQRCPKVNGELLSPIIRFLLRTEAEIGSATQHCIPQPAVFLFGPWSNRRLYETEATNINLQIYTRLQDLTSEARKLINYLKPNHALERQIESLAMQLSIANHLKTKGIIPHAVLGYCFGEFAAAIVAGVLSENAVLEVLVRRAAALDGVEGCMLNVFGETNVSKRILLRLSAPPDFAIFAGPKHVVLSGPTEQINSAHELLQAEDIKCKLIPSSIPFHSSVMTNIVKTLRLPSVDPRQAQCIYVSGLLGGPVDGEKLGEAYWLRHMRDPIQFYTAMQYLRDNLSTYPLCSCGPGSDLPSIITRYEWENISFCGDTKIIPRIDAKLPIKADSEQTSARIHNRQEKMSEMALAILSEKFHYPRNSRLLDRSFTELGLQSLDFVSFSDTLAEATGFTIPPSSFSSEASVKSVIDTQQKF